MMRFVKYVYWILMLTVVQVLVTDVTAKHHWDETSCKSGKIKLHRLVGGFHMGKIDENADFIWKAKSAADLFWRPLKLCYYIKKLWFICATSWENLLLPYANNKGTDQPAHLRSLISTFVVRCLESIIPLVSIYKILSRSLCSWADRFESTLVENPEDRFSHDEAHLIIKFQWDIMWLTKYHMRQKLIGFYFFFKLG